MEKAATWAEQEFGRTALGDVRRTRRLLQIAGGATRRPSGKVAEVFASPAEREGAYDFLESPLVKGEALAQSVFEATAARAEGRDHVFVSVDGSSLAITDENRSKGLGTIGSACEDVGSRRGCSVSVDGSSRENGVSSRTFSYLDYFAWWRVFGWLRKRHSALNKGKFVRRHLPTWKLDGGRVEFFRPHSVAITRYRYRGARIPTPWSSETPSSPASGAKHVESRMR